jgi:hypothetical protein
VGKVTAKKTDLIPLVTGAQFMNRICLVILILCLLSGQLHGEERTVSPTIQDVKAKHENFLLAMPGVVSVGIGKNPDGQFVIVVGLDGRHPETVNQLPKELEGYPVRAEVTGPVKAR